MGYMVEDTIHHLFVKERTTDFWETNLHHFCTLSLYGGMIMQNFVSVGVVISWLHAMSDVFTSMSRVWSQTHFKVMTVISFGVCILSWMWSRNYWIPWVTYSSIVIMKYPAELRQYQAAPSILQFFCSSLCVMHYYWIVLFLNMYIKGIMKWDNEDKQRGIIEKKPAEQAAKVE